MASVETSEIIEGLLKNARPGGQAHSKLTKYLSMVRRNVFIGPAATVFIQSLIDKTENTDCVLMATSNGVCKRNGANCQYTEMFSACAHYKKAKPTKSNAGQIIGGVNG